MPVRVSKYVPALLLLLSFGVNGCNDMDMTLRAGSLTGPGLLGGALVSAEPTTLFPEFLSSSTCRTHPAFRTHLSIVVRSERNLFLHASRFEFHDRFGARALPDVTLAASPAIVSTAVSAHSSLPIPIPGTLPLHGVPVSAGRPHTSSILLQFACGIRAAGILWVSVDIADTLGGVNTSRTSVRIGS